MTKKIIAVIAAHPDDEVLGCGGVMAKHVLLGDEVHVLIMAEGATSRDCNRNREEKSAELDGLALAASQAAGVLGVKTHELLAFPDNRMDSVDRLDVVKAIESFLEKYKPSVVYTHHAGDVNIDHRITHDAVIIASRPQPGHFVELILCFEIPSSTEWQTPDSRNCFVPNWFENIEGSLSHKLKALACYEQEMRPWPHARSYEAVEALAKWRGASIGVTAAEAFVLSRMIKREI